MKRGAAFDVQAVCSGFIFALAVADNAMRLGQARTALVIGAETFSRILDWKDRGTCVLFGDGAGAVVLNAVAGKGTSRPRHPARRICIPTAASTTSSMSMAARPRPAPPAFCAWKAARSSSRRCSISPRSVDEALAANGLTGGRHRLAGAAPGQQAHHRRGRPQARPAARASRSSRSNATPTPRRPRSRWRSTRRSPTAASGRASRADGGAGRRPDLGRQRRPLVTRRGTRGWTIGRSTTQRFGI